MKNYEWNTINGRFEAAGDIMRLENKGKKEEADKLRELLNEASSIYGHPEYYIFTDKANKKLVLLYGKRGISLEDTLFDQFVQRHTDDYVGHVQIGCTWLPGMVCQQCEPTFTAKKVERWNVFETEDNLWFEKM